MRKIIALLAAVAALAIPATAEAGTWNLHYNPFGSNTTAVENAVTYQYNHQVQPHWGGQTINITTGTGGAPVWFYSNTANAPCPTWAGGCHSIDGSYRIWVKVACFSCETQVLSHEIAEGTVNPYGTNPEIVDPVDQYAYTINGIWVEDFAYPEWFDPNGCGWVDHLGKLNKPC